jgi:hypothetical protein
MLRRAGKDEGPGADPDEVQAAGMPHPDERSLEYQRLLREETEGETRTFGAVRDAQLSVDAEPDPDEPRAKSEPRQPQPPAEAEPEPASPDGGGFGTARPSRQLQERIARLTRPSLASPRCSRSCEVETTVSRSHDDVACSTHRLPNRGGSSVGQSSGLIIRRSQVQVLPAPRQNVRPTIRGAGQRPVRGLRVRGR